MPVSVADQPAIILAVQHTAHSIITQHGCAGIAPELAPSGSGGSYFLCDRDRNVVAVFKPVDEEPNMRNNPRGNALPDQSRAFSPGSTPPKDVYVRRGILPGQGAYREIAAYFLSLPNELGVSLGVPATAPVLLTYPDGSAKHGSLQEFVKSDSDCEEMGYSMPLSMLVACDSTVHVLLRLECV